MCLFLAVLLTGCGISLDGEYLNANAGMSSSPSVLKIEHGRARFYGIGGTPMSRWYDAEAANHRLVLEPRSGSAGNRHLMRIEFEVHSDGRSLDCIGTYVAYAVNGRFWHLDRAGWSRTAE